MGFVADKMNRAVEALDVTLRLTTDLRSKAAVLSCYAGITRDPNDRSEVAFRLRFIDTVFPIRMRKSDIFTLSEIFHENEYALKSTIKPHPVILDCGSNIGLTPIWFLARFPGARVHAFEPEPENFRLLQKNLAGRRDVDLNRAAVGAEAGTVQLHLSVHGATHSVKDASAGLSTVDVDCINLGDYMRDRDIEHADILKLDVEGSELEVIEGLGDRLDDIGVVVGEFHETLVDEAKFYGHLQAHGFRVVQRRTSREGGVHLFECGRR